MEQWLKLMFIGIATNIDNLGIGVAYGIKRKLIPFWYNVIIAVISAVITFVSVASGLWMRHYVPQAAADLGGGLLIIILGLFTIWQVYRQSNNADGQQLHVAERSDTTTVAGTLPSQPVNIVSWQESIMLGLALSLNCIGIAFAEGIAGNSPWIVALNVGLFAMLTLEMGMRIGVKMANSWIDKHAQLISGLLLIAIGCYEILGVLLD